MLLDIIERAKANDSDAMVDIIDRFAPILRKYARLLRYEDAYEDLVVELIDFIQKFQPDKLIIKNDGAIVNYIGITLHNKYISLAKRHSMASTLEVTESDLTDAQKHVVENTMTAPANEFLDVTAYLSGRILTPRQERVIMLHYYDGYSISQIAKQDGVSRQNVNKIKKSALDKLRDAMVK